MTSVAVVLRQDKRKADGTAPIYFRMIKDRKPVYISSSKYIPIKDWDDARKRVRPSFPNSTRLNNLISNKLAELQGEVAAIETNAKSMTSRGLKEKIYGKAPTDFFSFADEVTESYKTGPIGTYDKNRSIIQKFREYNNGTAITFEEITYPFILKYEKYLRQTCGNGTNTVTRDLKYIKKIFNDAYKLGVVDPSINPFIQYEFKLEKTSKAILTEAQVKAIETVYFEPDSYNDLHRDMFVFGCYVGLRVSDILLLRWPDFDGTNINTTIKKTKEQISILVPNKGLEILRKYSAIREPVNFIFPMLPDDLDLDNPKEVDLAISRANAYINKNLKVISNEAGVREKISFHVSRHTFATLALRYGIPIEVVQKLMGHANIRETMIYAKIVNNEAQEAMKKFNR
jgi:integrase/recombinase XerD